MRKKRNQELLFELSQPRVAPKVTKQPECILEAMELISESANNTHLTDELFSAVEIPTNYLAERLQFTAMQSVLFSLLMDHSESSSIQLSDLAEITGCSTTRILRLSTCLEDLAQRFYVRIKRGRSCDSYRIPREVIMSLRDDKPYDHKTECISDVNEFFDCYGRIFDERRSQEITYRMFKKLIEENLEQISDSHFSQSLRKELWDADDRLLFIHMAFLYIFGFDDFIDMDEISGLYDDEEKSNSLKHELRLQMSSLQERLIENSNKDGMAQPDSYKLTDYAKTDVLSEVSLKDSKVSNHQLTKCETLKEKTLIYNEKEQEQISQLSAILYPERFKSIQEQLDKSGMRRGFCCLFYGAPGTGKTETVYQIARQTGRDILQINADEIKSCWVGESEKNIKQVFDRYRCMCKDNQTAPILLFNEADAVLGLRMEGAVRGVDKMENSIQNIILQEMESLDGIMIATTNLTSNLDDAFERRFLYKIRFEKPTVEARAKIWMQMLKGLTPKDARLLAARFDLTGGEIENVARKHSVSAILAGTDILDINELCKICEQERIQTGSCRRVGFR